MRLFVALILLSLAVAWLTGQHDHVVDLAEQIARQRQAQQSAAARDRPEAPAEAAGTIDGGLAVTVADDGHFYLEILVNGARIPFVVDTGASAVFLTRDAARRARITPNRMDYTHEARTANGTVRIAPVTVREMRIGDLRLNQVGAAVNDGEMGTSLLGMTFLSRLKSYEFTGEQLVLRW